MTDNHPLTPKPVDDSETEFGDHQVLPVDREAYLSLNMLPEFGAADVRAGRWDNVTGLQAFARHREQAERGLREAAELLQRAQAETFGSMVGGGDGGTYVVKTLSGKTLNDIRSFLARKALDTRP